MPWPWLGLTVCSATALIPIPASAVIMLPTGAEAYHGSLYEPAPPGTGHGTEPIRLSSGPQLFIDEFLIASTTGLTRRVNVPVRDPQIPNPLITGADDGCVAPYVTVIRDPHSGQFRVWYDAYVQEPVGYSAIVSTMQSADGIHWNRPHATIENLPLFNASVLDEGQAFPNAAERYKLSWWIGDALKLFVSPDGLAWSAWTRETNLRRVPGAVVNVGDIHNISWDPVRRRYMATFGMYAEGPTWSGKRRVAVQSTSTDFATWTAPNYVVTPDDSREPGETQFYMMSGYAFRGDLIVGLVKVLHDDWTAAGVPAGAYGTGHTTLAWTRDGTHWIRDTTPFFEADPDVNAWDHAVAWIDCQVPMGDTTYLYYGGYRYGHKMDPQTGRCIGMVELERDRYVSRDAGTEGGALLTPLIVTSADRITVNARVNGELKIRILDQDDQPLPGFGWSDFNVLRGDSFSHPAQWNGDFSALKGTPIKLEFSLVDGQLYGFDVPAGTMLPTRFQNFDSSPSTWVGYNNQSGPLGTSYGFSNSANAGGTAGEAGGTLPERINGVITYYADTDFFETLSQKGTVLTAGGRIKVVSAYSDGGLKLGWFDKTVAPGWNDYVGLTIAGQTDGVYWGPQAILDQYAFAYNPPGGFHSPHTPLVIGETYLFSMTYDPTGTDATHGSLTVELRNAGDNSLLESITTSNIVSGAGNYTATLDAFGLQSNYGSSIPGGNYEVFVDNLSYTAPAPSALTLLAVGLLERLIRVSTSTYWPAPGA